MDPLIIEAGEEVRVRFKPGVIEAGEEILHQGDATKETRRVRRRGAKQADYRLSRLGTSFSIATVQGAAAVWRGAWRYMAANLAASCELRRRP